MSRRGFVDTSLKELMGSRTERCLRSLSSPRFVTAAPSRPSAAFRASRSGISTSRRPSYAPTRRNLRSSIGSGNSICGEPGMPCELCNQPREGERPRMPRGFTPTFDADKGPIHRASIGKLDHRVEPVAARQHACTIAEQNHAARINRDKVPIKFIRLS